MKLLELKPKIRPAYLEAIEDHTDFYIVRLQGEVSTYALERNREKMTAVIEEYDLNSRSVLIDMGKVTDSDTATIAALIKRFAEFRKRGGNRKMVFFNVRSELRSLFEITHLFDLFVVCESEKDAVLALK